MVSVDGMTHEVARLMAKCHRIDGDRLPKVFICETTENGRKYCVQGRECSEADYNRQLDISQRYGVAIVIRDDINGGAGL